MRRAGPDDAPALARMRYEFRASFAPPTEDEAAFVPRCTAWMRDCLADGTAWRCWVLDAGGVILGHIWLQLIDKIPNPLTEHERHGYISNVYVVEQARSQGLGRRLIETALDHCREQNVDSVILWPSQLSRPLYERLGFAVRDDILQTTLHDGRRAH